MNALRRIMSPGSASRLRPSSSKILIKTDTLAESMNPVDQRMIRKLEKPITVELMDKMELANDSLVYRFALPGR